MNHFVESVKSGNECMCTDSKKFWLHSPGGSWMLCTLGCPGEVWASLGANIWGVRARIPPGPAATVTGIRGVLTAPGVTAGCCGADCITAVGGSALIMCDPALTDTELDGWLLFTSGVFKPIPAWPVVLATTAGLALLFPFKVAPDPAVCIGGLTSATVGPAVWLTGWAEATTLCEFMRGVCITLFEEGGIIAAADPLDITGPLPAAVTDTAAQLLLPAPLATAVPPGGAALPEPWEFIVWLPLKVCAECEPAFPGWWGREVTPSLTTSVLPGSCPALESVLAVDASIAEPWGPRRGETPLHFNLFRRSTNNPECDGARLWHMYWFSLSAPALAFRVTLGEAKRKTTLVVYSVPASAIVLTKSQLDISSRYPLVPEL